MSHVNVLQNKFVWDHPVDLLCVLIKQDFIFTYEA